MIKKGWGFDTRDLDTKVRPQDDFYHYAAGGWLKKNKIPSDEAAWGTFRMLRHKTEIELQDFLQAISRKRVEKGSSEQMIRDLYRSYLDTKTREKRGTTPLKAWLERIASIRTSAELVKVFAELEKIGGGAPWGLMVDQDFNNPDHYALFIHQSGLGLPDRDYYLLNKPEFVRVRTAYEKHIEKMLTLAGATKADAKKSREIIMRLETSLAKASMPKEEMRDPDKLNNRFSLQQLSSLTSTVDWLGYLKKIGIKKPADVVVMQPEFLKKAVSMLDNEPIEDWKIYLHWHLLSGTSSLMSETLEKEHFNFYGKVLSGTPKMREPWRRALGAVNGTVGELLGRLYVDAYFGSDAKAKVEDIVDDLFVAYTARLKALDWMSAGTKKKALVKLKAMRRKLGYPSKWRSYKGLRIEADDLFGNMERASLREHARVLRKLTKPVDREEWHMFPHTVNAYYNPPANEIVFPAGILQAPIFDLSADDAVNYGGMGSVIGHEITHGFDDSGSKFDEKGRLKSWWTAEDRKSFDSRSKVLVKQFNKYRVADELQVNGELTLGENIADLGGASIAYDALQIRLEKTGRALIDGFTPEQRFFLGLASIERENRRPEAVKTQVTTDPHSPSEFRINGPVSNLPEFYEAFGVKKGDKLYREPKDRAKIW